MGLGLAMGLIKGVAAASAVAVLAVPTVWMPSLVLVIAALLGLALVRDPRMRAGPVDSAQVSPSMPQWVPTAALTTFVVLLVGLPALGYNFSDAEPVGWVDARFRPDGVSLTLRALAGNRADDGQTSFLEWPR